ncbi:MAG: hypothetical protein JJU06_01665 [Ectothiorhodospiraceae bacterium]|nr:hypothetical protein [Ectothiorhodospiraceae bacterium]
MTILNGLKPLTIPLAATLLLVGCGGNDGPPALRGELCEFRYDTFGTATVVTDRATLRRSLLGWQHEEHDGCAGTDISHDLGDGASYRFREGTLRYVAPGDGNSSVVKKDGWPAFVHVAFRSAWPRIRIQGSVMNEGPLHAYGLGEDGSLWLIRLSRAGHVRFSRQVDRLPDTWAPLAIAAPAGLRVVTLASNDSDTRLFHYRIAMGSNVTTPP